MWQQDKFEKSSPKCSLVQVLLHFSLAYFSYVCHSGITYGKIVSYYNDRVPSL